jgi:predicted metalloprotease with PDZ domain
MAQKHEIKYVMAAFVAAWAGGCTSAEHSAWPVEVRLRIPAHPSDALEVELLGDFGAAEGRELRGAAGAVGAYAPCALGAGVFDMEAFDAEGGALRIEAAERCTWTVRGAGSLRRVRYRVDLSRALERSGDPLVCGVRSARHARLSGYAWLMRIGGAEDFAYEIRLALPEGWRAVSALQRAIDGAWRAESLFEALDEPLLAGADVLSRRVETPAGTTWVHLQSAGESAGRPDDLARLAAAATDAGAAVAALRLPPLGRPYHVFYELCAPAGSARAGWALEHGASFCGVEALDARIAGPRLAYHLLHHQLHSWLPRRVYTDRLAPMRQLDGEVSGFVWFAEGFAQYLAFVGLARSGAVPLATVQRMLARRFGLPYAAGVDGARSSLIELSEAVCRGDHERWTFGYAAGGLLALAIDQRLRARAAGAEGLADVLSSLAGAMSRHPEGISEDRFEDVFAAASGCAIGDLMSRHVRGDAPLPWRAILAGAGIEIVADVVKCMSDNDLSPAARAFLAASFEAPPPAAP